MSNPNIVRVLRESVDEHRAEELNNHLKKQKLIFIEDIFKIRKRLYAIGRSEYAEHLNSERSGKLFDFLYEKSLIELHALIEIYTGLEDICNEAIQKAR